MMVSGSGGGVCKWFNTKIKSVNDGLFSYNQNTQGGADWIHF
jgi:hypothetical protein